MKKLSPEIIEFLDHSNRIESEYSKRALTDAKRAWRFAMTAEKMTVPYILEIQRLLLHRISPDLVGFRTYPVRIGWQVKGFESIETFERQLQMICDAMNDPLDKMSKEGREEIAKNAHVAYEAVHAFGDGNGRSGRIIYNWHRLQLGLPIHIIHEGDEQWEYYKLFDQVKPI